MTLRRRLLGNDVDVEFAHRVSLILRLPRLRHVHVFDATCFWVGRDQGVVPICILLTVLNYRIRPGARDADRGRAPTIYDRLELRGSVVEHFVVRLLRNRGMA